MLYDRIANNQSQKRYTMDSLKEKDNPASNPSKRPRNEVGEADTPDDCRRVFMDSRVNNGILNGLKHKTEHTCFTTV